MGNFSYNDIKKKIRLPIKENSKLAEFFGVLSGDGYMNLYRKYDYVVEIAGNKLLDKDYLTGYLVGLIKGLFNTAPNYIERKDQNTSYLRICSKAIFNYLIIKGFKKGKKGLIRIPSWIIENKQFMNSFVKGLFDTDGCISIKNKEGKKYPVISITSKSRLLLDPIKRYIQTKGINSYITKHVVANPRYTHKLICYKLQVNGYNNLVLWFKLIGSSNKRNIDRYHLSNGFS